MSVERSGTVQQAKPAHGGAEPLYERCAGRCWRSFVFGSKRLRARLESRDILQATLLKSLGHLDDLRADETRSLMAWLARIAEHEIRDCADFHHRERRDAARDVAMDDDAPLPALTRSALSGLILDEQAQQLEAALESLSPAHREVILLRKFEEFPLRRSPAACRLKTRAAGLPRDDGADVTCGEIAVSAS